MAEPEPPPSSRDSPSRPISGSGSGSAPAHEPDAVTEQSLGPSWVLGGAEAEQPASKPSSAEDLAESLSLSGLFRRDQLDELRDSLGDSDAESFADLLVRDGRLTRYQADVLLEGHGQSLVLGNYSIVGRLGEGGMGQVFMAVHRVMNRQVAVKVLPPALTRSEAAITRFRREVETAARLVHPNIAAAYDADEHEGVHFLVLEYVDGPNLSAYVKQAGPLPVAAAVQLVLQAARGLAQAHEVGVVHRDVKPANLVVDRKGTLKVLDVGLARLHDTEVSTQLTQSGKVMGTVDFMAPEQAIDAKRVDPRADIYSLGCTLFYLLTGRSLAPPGTLTQKLLWHQNEDLPSLQEERRDVPASLEAVYRAMVARDPDGRQSSMAEVIQDLQGCLAELPAEELRLELIDVTLDAHSPNSAAGSSPSLSRASRDKARATGWRRLPSAWRWAGAVGLLALVTAGAWLLRPEAAPLEPNERLARMALQHGGSVSVGSAEGGAPKEVATLEALPGGRFSLRGVDLSGTSVQDDDLLQMPELRGVKRLSLADTGIGDAALRGLGRLADLAELDLSGTRVSDAGLEALTALPQLRELNLQKTAVGDEAIARLAPLHELERLYLSNTALGDAGLAQAPALSSLRSLAINGTQVTAKGHATLRDAVPALSITWDGEEIDRRVANWILDGELRSSLSIAPSAGDEIEGLKQKKDLPAEPFHVVAIDLSRNLAVGDRDLERLKELRRLRSLNLAGTGISSAGLLSLHGQKRLRELRLGQLELSAQALADLRAALPKCKLEHVPANEAAAAEWAVGQGGRVTLATADGEILSELTSLEELPKGAYRVRSMNLEGLSAIGDEDLARLRDLPNLEELFLTGTGIGDAALEQLAGCASLRVLGLSDTAVSSKALADVARLTPLRQLQLAGTAVTGEGLQRLRRLTSLTHLSLARTRLGDGDLVHLKALPSLGWLSLSESPFSDAAVAHLERLEGLTELWINGTAIDDGGAARLAAALPACLIQR